MSARAARPRARASGWETCSPPRAARPPRWASGRHVRRLPPRARSERHRAHRVRSSSKPITRASGRETVETCPPASRSSTAARRRRARRHVRRPCAARPARGRPIAGVGASVVVLIARASSRRTCLPARRPRERHRAHRAGVGPGDMFVGLSTTARAGVGPGDMSGDFAQPRPPRRTSGREACPPASAAACPPASHSSAAARASASSSGRETCPRPRAARSPGERHRAHRAGVGPRDMSAGLAQFDHRGASGSRSSAAARASGSRSSVAARASSGSPRGRRAGRHVRGPRVARPAHGVGLAQLGRRVSVIGLTARRAGRHVRQPRAARPPRGRRAGRHVHRPGAARPPRMSGSCRSSASL